MNRTIKFRGRRPNGELLYGFFVGGEKLTYIIDFQKHGQCIVDPKTVSQLITTDINGNEIYEGDKVIRIAGDDFDPEKTFPMFATFDHFAAINNGEIILEV